MARSITDDRGRPITLYGLRDDIPRLRRANAIPREIRKKIDQRLRTQLTAATITTTIVTMVTAAGLCTALAVALAHGEIKMSLPLSLGVFALAGGGIALGIAFARRAVFERMFSGRIVEAFLGERRCPACGYDLTGVDAGEDRFTTCPECGAAWRVESRPGDAE